MKGDPVANLPLKTPHQAMDPVWCDSRGGPPWNLCPSSFAFPAVLQRALGWHGERTDEERVMSPAPQTAVTATRASTVTYTLLTALLPSTMSQTIRSLAL